MSFRAEILLAPATTMTFEESLRSVPKSGQGASQGDNSRAQASQRMKKNLQRRLDWISSPSLRKRSRLESRTLYLNWASTMNARSNHWPEGGTDEAGRLEFAQAKLGTNTNRSAAIMRIMIASWVLIILVLQRTCGRPRITDSHAPEKCYIRSLRAEYYSAFPRGSVCRS